MSKYLAVSLLTVAFLLGFFFQVGAQFQVARIVSNNPSTAYPQINDPLADSAFDTNNQAAVYERVLYNYQANYINNFWQP